MSEGQPSAEQIAAALKLQDDFKKAFPSQDLLGDIPEDALPPEYRQAIRLRSDRDSFYVAFSDNPDDLQPTEEGLLPKANLKQIPIFSGPRGTGRMIKTWIDGMREPPKPK